MTMTKTKKIYLLEKKIFGTNFYTTDLETGETGKYPFWKIQEVAEAGEAVFIYEDRAVQNYLIENNIYTDNYIDLDAMYLILFGWLNNIRTALPICNKTVGFCDKGTVQFHELALGFFKHFNELVRNRCGKRYLLYKYIQRNNSVYIQNTKMIKEAHRIHKDSTEFNEKDVSLFQKLSKLTDMAEGFQKLNYTYGRSAGGRYGSPTAHSIPRNVMSLRDRDILTPQDDTSRKYALSVTRGIVGMKGGYVHSLDLKGADFVTIKTLCDIDQDLTYTTFVPINLQYLSKNVRKTIILAVFFGIGEAGMLKKFPDEDPEHLIELRNYCLKKYAPANKIYTVIKNNILRCVDEKMNSITVLDDQIKPKYSISLYVIPSHKKLGTHLCNCEIYKYGEKEIFAEILIKDFHIRDGEIQTMISEGSAGKKEKAILAGNMKSYITQNVTQRRMEDIIHILRTNVSISNFMFIHDEIIFSTSKSTDEIDKILKEHGKQGYTIKTADSVLELGCHY